MNSRAELIKGNICGVKTKEFQDPLMKITGWIS